MAPLHASRKLTHAIRERVQPARSSANGEDQAPAAVRPAYPFPHAWLEKRLELVRGLFSQPSSELWSFISRPRIEALLNGPEADRARYQEALLRATTVFWHFHGPPA